MNDKVEDIKKKLQTASFLGYVLREYASILLDELSEYYEGVIKEKDDSMLMKSNQCLHNQVYAKDKELAVKCEIIKELESVDNEHRKLMAKYRNRIKELKEYVSELEMIANKNADLKQQLAQVKPLDETEVYNHVKNIRSSATSHYEIVKSICKHFGTTGLNPLDSNAVNRFLGKFADNGHYYLSPIQRKEIADDICENFGTPQIEKEK